MREVIRLSANECVPKVAAILKSQGMSRGKEIPPALRENISDAVSTFTRIASPVGILADITIEDFAAVYHGEGMNSAPSPLASIVPQADFLVLFAATIGPAAEQRVKQMFEQRRFDLGYLVDAAASEGVEQAAAQLEKYVMENRLPESIAFMRDSLVARRYSPGYCGWHVSGQRKLFAQLSPEEVGITLRDSYLMEPLKSVSGVIVVGPPHIHEFRPEYDFCLECRARECRAKQDLPEPA